MSSRTVPGTGVVEPIKGRFAPNTVETVWRVSRPDPVQGHRLLATLTLGVIGASLCTVALLAPVANGGAGEPASAVFTQP